MTNPLHLFVLYTAQFIIYKKYALNVTSERKNFSKNLTYTRGTSD